MANSVGVEGMVELVYLGKQQPAVWDGNATNTRYRFGKGKERGWVDPRDAGKRGEGRGFLNVKDSKGNWLFELGTPEAAPATQKVVKGPVKGNEPTVVIGDAAPVVEAPAMVVTDDIVHPTPIEDEGEEVPVDDLPDMADMTVRDILAMDLDKAGWRKVYQVELASEKPRKSLITALEEKLASE